MKRFSIPLTWLDLKRVQFPLSPEEERFLDANITSQESFEPGWLNDEVMYQPVMLVQIYNGYFIFPGHYFRLFQVVNFYFALLEETTSIKVSDRKGLALELASSKSNVAESSNFLFVNITLGKRHSLFVFLLRNTERKKNSGNFALAKNGKTFYLKHRSLSSSYQF